MSGTLRPQKTCKECKTAFAPSRSDHEWCSPKCRIKRYNQRNKLAVAEWKERHGTTLPPSIINTDD